MKLRLSRFLVAIFCVLWGGNVYGSRPELSPKPDKVVWLAGELRIKEGVNLVHATETHITAMRLKAYFEQAGIPVTLNPTDTESTERPTIHLKLVSEVPGVPGASLQDAYHVMILGNQCWIEATSSHMLRRAQSVFYQLSKRQTTGFPLSLFRKRTTFSVPCCEVTQWTAVKEDADPVLDLTKKYIPISELSRQLTHLAKGGKTRVFVQLIGSEGWRIESNTFRLINAKESIYVGKYYSMKELNQLNQQCERLGVELIPQFSMVENARFQEVTGHLMHSVEGLRFVTALFEEYVRGTEFKTFCLTSPDKRSNNRLVPIFAKYDRDYLIK